MNKFSRAKLKFLLALSSGGAYGDRARGKAYQKYLASCGCNFKVAEQAYIYSPEYLHAGDHVYVGFGSYLGNGEIIFEDEVLIGNHVSVTAANHLRKNGSYRFGGSERKTITVGSGTWVGAHSCITAGVTLGSGCMVAAGSVVTRSFPDGVLIAGAPAKIVKDLDG